MKNCDMFSCSMTFCFPLKFYKIKSNTSKYQRRRAFMIIIKEAGQKSVFRKLQYGLFCHTTAAFTYYYDPAILRNKLTPLSIFKDLALRK